MIDDVRLNYQYYTPILETILYLGYDIKLHLIMELQSWISANVEYSFIRITLRSTLTRSDSTCWDPINESDKYI